MYIYNYIYIYIYIYIYNMHIYILCIVIIIFIIKTGLPVLLQVKWFKNHTYIHVYTCTYLDSHFE